MSQGPINLGGAGDIDIYPEETRAVLQRLQQAGTTFSETWGRLSAAIQAGEATCDTGFDTLSKNFRAQYNPAKQPLQEASDNVRPNLDGLANGGQSIVTQYEQAAERDAARMRALGG